MVAYVCCFFLSQTGKKNDGEELPSPQISLCPFVSADQLGMEKSEGEPAWHLPPCVLQAGSVSQGRGVTPYL